VQSSISSGLITSSTSFEYALAKGSLAKEGYASSKVLVSNSSKIPLAYSYLALVLFFFSGINL